MNNDFLGFGLKPKCKYFIIILSIPFGIFLIFDKKNNIMDTASVPGLIKTLFYIILFYYLFKFAMRLLAPYLMQQVAKKAEEQIKKQFEYQQQQQYQSQHQSQPTTEKVKKEDKKIGDYIDYEEIE